LLWLVMGCLYSHHLREKPADYFDFFIKIGLVRELLKGKDADSRDQYVRHLDFPSIYDGLRIARRALTILRRDTTTPFTATTLTGTLRIYSRKGFRKEEFFVDSPENREFLEANAGSFYKDLPENTPYYGGFCNTLGTLENNIQGPNKVFAKLPFSIVKNPQDLGGTYLSLFNLLGVISHGINAPPADATLEQLRDALGNQLKRDGVVQSFFTIGESDDAARLNDPDKGDDPEGIQFEDNEVDSTEPDPTEPDPTEFIACLQSWIGAGKNVDPVPIYILARMSTRFYFTLGSMDGELKATSRFPGTCLHRFIVAFLNSVLVEILIYYGQEPKLSNATTSDMIFLKNLKLYIKALDDSDKKDPDKKDSDKKDSDKIDSDKKDLARANLFGWIWSCPIWGYFLNSEEEGNKDSVWELYLAQVEAENEDEDEVVKKYEAMFSTSYQRHKKENSVSFKNLFPLLNSLALPLSTSLTKEMALNRDSLKRFELLFNEVPPDFTNLSSDSGGKTEHLLGIYADSEHWPWDSSEIEQQSLLARLLNKNFNNRIKDFNRHRKKDREQLQGFLAEMEGMRPKQ